MEKTNTTKLSEIIDKSKLSPMMQQYVDTKDNYFDCLLFYRLGDFYELFFEDAKIASKVLDIALTARNCGNEQKAPMCGVPYHAVESYIAKLIEQGYKVAICDQISEPEAGKIVQREVTRIITPGTVIETDILDEKSNNYILSVCKENDNIGIAYSDISTGEFRVSEFNNSSLQDFIDFLTRIKPAEIICNDEMLQISYDKSIKSLDFIPNFSRQPDYSFDEQNAKEQIKKQFNIQNLKGHDFASLKYAVKSTGALITYLLETQKRSLNHINKIATEKSSDYMVLDYNVCKNLELVQNARDRKKKGSLLAHLNKTKTAMGSRLLERWILQPLQNSKDINSRLDCLEELFYNPMLLNDIQGVLNTINDIARTCSKISFGTIMPKECENLKNSLYSIINLSIMMQDLNNPVFKSLFSNIESVKNIAELLDQAIEDNPPNITANGGYIKQNFNKELYDLKNISTKTKKDLEELELREKESTGIKNLKIGYSRIFGYYIEINKSQENLVPYRYIRKQTIANHERFITEELKQIEVNLINAQTTALKLESEIYDKIKEQLKNLVPIIQQTADDVSFVDVICSLALVSQDYQYVRPNISERFKHIKIENGRHAIVEANLKNESFVPNDTYLDDKQDRTIIITGPNMAGKSTYMRQIALITIMAHIGCFVPASKAELPIIDRIFTRIGANDDLNSGQSTFMVEMVEVANILNNATSKSLVLLDEVGRGTATYDGMSIAWAVLEYVSQTIRCKTLFSTHYHEITALEGKLEGIKNYKIGVKEFNNSIIFLRKITRGSADRSFGIEVAALSGIYQDVVTRAKVILNQLEKNAIRVDLNKIEDAKELSVQEQKNIINELKNIDINKITPIEAFEILLELNKKVKDKD